MKKIAIYGKGGIGKSTAACCLSAALAARGFRVMQIGCDPKADSTRNLMNGVRIPTVLDQIREKGEDIALEDIAFIGYQGIVCVESGGPMPGIGCAGRGIIAALEKLEELNAYEVYRPDIVFFDVLGDVVCGGFAMPIRDGYADDVVIITSGEMMALFAADNISRAIHNFSKRGYARLLGYVQNSRNVRDEDALVQKAAGESGTKVLFVIPRDELVQRAEEQGMTVIEAFPDSDISKKFNELATVIMEETANE